VFDKLRQIESRYEELSVRLAEAANAPAGRTEYARLAKAAAEIEPVVTAFGQYKGVLAIVFGAGREVTMADCISPSSPRADAFAPEPPANPPRGSLWTLRFRP